MILRVQTVTMCLCIPPLCTSGRASPTETKSEKSSLTQMTGMSGGTGGTALAGKLSTDGGKAKKAAEAFFSLQLEKVRGGLRNILFLHLISLPFSLSLTSLCVSVSPSSLSIYLSPSIYLYLSLSIYLSISLSLSLSLSLSFFLLFQSSRNFNTSNLNSLELVRFGI